MNNTSKLEALNDMLATIGESPITNLIGDQTADVALAVQILDKNTRFVQNNGWGWNTDYNYLLVRNDEDRVVLPSNASHIEFKFEGDIDPVRRGDQAYDRKNHTPYFAKDLTAYRIVWTLDYEQMSQAARDYVMIRAAREFAQKVMPGEAVAYTAQDEQAAWAKLRNDENRSENRGFAVDTRITNRNHGCR